MTKRLRNARSRVVIAVTPARSGRRDLASGAVPDTAVTRPALAWFALLDGGVVALTTLVASPALDARARRLVRLPSRPALRALLLGTLLVHVGEAAAAHRTARRHGLPALGWAGQTFVVGFPSLLALRRAVGASAA